MGNYDRRIAGRTIWLEQGLPGGEVRHMSGTYVEGQPVASKLTMLSEPCRFSTSTWGNWEFGFIMQKSGLKIFKPYFPVTNVLLPTNMWKYMNIHTHIHKGLL